MEERQREREGKTWREREKEREREREGGPPNGLWCPWVSMARLVLPLVWYGMVWYGSRPSFLRLDQDSELVFGPNKENQISPAHVHFVVCCWSARTSTMASADEDSDGPALTADDVAFFSGNSQASKFLSKMKLPYVE